MVAAIRNLGRPGIASMAISAVDAALWDLKARLLDLPLVTLLGAVRESAPVYGSGGFTSYSIGQLQEQLGGWVAAGIPRVKMKIGRQPADDLDRVRAAREAIGPDAELFVDANGAYSRKQALAQAERFAELGVTLVRGAGLLRRPRRAAAARATAARPAWTSPRGNTVTTCFTSGGCSKPAPSTCSRPTRRGAPGSPGSCASAPSAEAHGLPLSAHCAPSLHAHPACALPNFRHLEYFHDHDRIEHMLFDGALTPVGGRLAARPRPAPGWASNSSARMPLVTPSEHRTDDERTRHR